MAFNPVLMIMQPRQINESINSLKNNIDIPKVWFRAYNEENVQEEMNKFVRKTKFSHYIVMGDDGVVSKKAADTILKYGEMQEYDVFTGWMNMHLEEDGSLSQISTVSQGILSSHYDPVHGPTRKDYPKWLHVKWVKEQEGVIQTTMANYAMSMAERDIFLKFPLKTHPNGCSSDHHWSRRLQLAGLKVWTHPKAFIKHLRRGWKPLEDKWLVGTIPPKTILDKMWLPREFYK